eukprot:15452347-Alexandrium_andersonii.AAC.1
MQTIWEFTPVRHARRSTAARNGKLDDRQSMVLYLMQKIHRMSFTCIGNQWQPGLRHKDVVYAAAKGGARAPSGASGVPPMETPRKGGRSGEPHGVHELTKERGRRSLDARQRTADALANLAAEGGIGIQHDHEFTALGHVAQEDRHTVAPPLRHRLTAMSTVRGVQRGDGKPQALGLD